MGISGLLTLLKSIHQPKHIRDWTGKTVGVDAYVWLHKGAIACAIDLALGNSTSKYVDYAMHRVRMLKHFGVTPYLVFDGDYLPSKAATESGRERKRHQSRQTGLELLKLGRTSQAHLELQKAIDVTPIMARHLIDACKAIGVQCIVAPYEADAQLFYLERTGVIDAIVSEDSDLLVFGARCLITKLDQFGECVEINRDLFSACKEVSLAGWTDTEFRHMCILSGCDYLENIPKMGLKTAHRLVRRYKQVEKIVRIASMDGMAVPKGYLDGFKQADITFQHQRVFCPTKNELVMCNEPTVPLEDESLIYIGVELDLDLARGIACGNIDPITKAPIVVEAQSPRNGLVKSKAWLPPSKPLSSPGNKTITAFFKPKTQPQVRPRAPLQTITTNRLPSTAIPSQSQTTVSNKRSLSSLTPTAKRPCLSPAEDLSENVIKTGERSSFFQTPNHSQSRRSLPRFTCRRDSTVSKKNSEIVKQQPPPQPLNGPEEDHSSQVLVDDKLQCSVEVTNPVKAVADGWKSKYGFKEASSAKCLSSIIKKQKSSGGGSARLTPLQRLGAASLNRSKRPINVLQPFDPPLKSLSTPVISEARERCEDGRREDLGDDVSGSGSIEPKGFRSLVDRFSFGS